MGVGGRTGGGAHARATHLQSQGRSHVGAGHAPTHKPLRAALDWEWETVVGGGDELRPILLGPREDQVVRGKSLMGEDFFWALEQWRDAEEARYASM